MAKFEQRGLGNKYMLSCVNPKIGLGQISTQQPPQQWVAYVVLGSTMPGETYIGHLEHEYVLKH